MLALARREPEDAMIQKPCPHADDESRDTDTCGEHVSRDGECGHSEPFPSGSVPWYATPRAAFDEPRPRLSLYLAFCHHATGPAMHWPMPWLWACPGQGSPTGRAAKRG